MNTFKTFPKADWYALGSDTTVWMPQNLQRALSFFSPRSRVFLGGTRSTVDSQMISSFGQGHTSDHPTVGGAGMVVSYAVMEELQVGLAECFARLRHIQESKDRISTCIETFSNTSAHALFATGLF